MSILAKYPADGGSTGFDCLTVCSEKRWTFPFPDYNTFAFGTYELDYIIALSSYTPGIIAPTTSYVSETVGGVVYYLVSESPIQDIGMGIGKFTRTFAPICSTRYDYQSYSVKFPGLVFGTAPNTVTRTSWVCPSTYCKIEYKYYLPGISVGVTTIDDITIEIPKELTLICDSAGNFVDTYENASAESITWATGLSYTTKTNSEYLALVTGSTWIVAADSTIRRFMGPIYERETRYVLAQ